MGGQLAVGVVPLGPFHQVDARQSGLADGLGLVGGNLPAIQTLAARWVRSASTRSGSRLRSWASTHAVPGTSFTSAGTA